MIAILSADWGAKTVRRRLGVLGLSHCTVAPDKNPKLTDAFDAIIYLPKAISHGAQNAARAWARKTGKPAICLAKTTNLEVELQKAGLLASSSDVALPPKGTIPVSKAVAKVWEGWSNVRLSHYQTTRRWITALVGHTASFSFDDLRAHPDFPTVPNDITELVGAWQNHRYVWRRKYGLLSWRKASGGVAVKARDALPLDYMPQGATAGTPPAPPAPEVAVVENGAHPVDQWLKTVITPPDDPTGQRNRIFVNQLYSAYVEWAEDQGEDVALELGVGMTNVGFGKRLSELGYKRGNSSGRYVRARWQEEPQKEEEDIAQRWLAGEDISAKPEAPTPKVKPEPPPSPDDALEDLAVAISMVREVMEKWRIKEVVIPQEGDVRLSNHPRLPGTIDPVSFVFEDDG